MFDLQTALDSGAMLIDVPAGVSPITTQVNWPRRPVTLRGCGAGVSVLEVGSLPIGIRAYGTQAEPITGLRIADLTIRGTANDESAAVELIEIGDYVNGVTFGDVEFAWAKKSGLRFTANVFGSGLHVERCAFRDIATPQMIAINGGGLQGCLHQTIIRDCTFANIGQNSTQHALYLSTSSTTPIDDVLVTGCTYQGLYSDLSISGGVYRGVRVCDNVFHCLKNRFYTGALISGNIFADSVATLGAAGILFTGNQIIRTQALEGVAIEGGANKVIVVGNTFDRQTTAAFTCVTVYAGPGHVIERNFFINTAYSSGAAMDVRIYGGAVYSSQGNVLL